MAKKPRIKADAKKSEFVPFDRDSCARAINEIGRLQRILDVSEAQMNEEIAQITDKYKDGIGEIKETMSLWQEGVQAWCESNRDALTEGGKTKTGRFVTGEVQWRQRPPSVSLRGVSDVIETLCKLGLDRFVRTKQEINKDAILNDPTGVSGVPGISIKTGVEDFVITPFEQEIA